MKKLIQMNAVFAMAILGAISLGGCSHVQTIPDVHYADPSEVGMSAETLGLIQPSLQPFIDSSKLPGFVTLVARNGKIVHQTAFGSRDVEARLPMESDTIFRMFSMTKPITAVAVMQLVDRGAISLDDPVSDYIPEFGEMEVLARQDDGTTNRVPATVTMTLKHLMTHTSGLSYGVLNPAAYTYYEEAGLNEFHLLSLEEFARRAGSVPLLHEPGAAWNYSIGMDILGRVVEVASGQLYEDYLQDNLFGPLGMVDSGFYVPEEKQDRFAQVYAPVAEGTGMVAMNDPLFFDFRSPPAMASGGGGAVGTVEDYYRFAQMLINGGELDGVRVLSEESARAIITDQLDPSLGDAPLNTLLQLSVRDPDDPAPAGNSERPSGMASMAFRGLGFGYCGSVVKEGAMPIFGSPGSYWWGGLASTEFWIDPKENLVAVACTQLIPAGTYPTRMVFSNLIYKSIREGSPAMEAASAN